MYFYIHQVSYNKGQTDTVPNDVIKGPLKVQ